MEVSPKTPGQVELRRIMTRDGLSRQAVAKLICNGREERVRAWLKPQHNKSFRSVPVVALRLLDLVAGVSVHTGVDAVKAITGATTREVFDACAFALSGLSGVLEANAAVGEALATGATRRVFGVIVSPAWVLLPMSGPLGRCYMATCGSVVHAADGTCQMILDVVYKEMDAETKTDLRTWLLDEEINRSDEIYARAAARES